ncbi:hypothetical protein EVAR_52262_1 [Eumeta japonica]|uniref:Uncharacterized protein n=1 Tax=Eumeta variegata TaxID=151549 RepID=A0A4C1YVN1_EUMVA|nr:hypothetical protein EVAR_52262_1 [Eumeta japonica]
MGTSNVEKTRIAGEPVLRHMSSAPSVRMRLVVAVAFTSAQYLYRLCAAAVSFLLGRIGRWSGREVVRSAFSFVRSAQAERDKE